MVGSLTVRLDLGTGLGVTWGVVGGWGGACAFSEILGEDTTL